MTDADRGFRGAIIDVDVAWIELPNGARCRFEIVRHPGGAAAVALDERRRICLLRQYRPAVGDWLWELPAGKLEPDEAPLATARRELADEAGLQARRWQPLGEIVSSPGVFSEVVHLFLATELMPVAAGPEPGEVFELHWLDFAAALEMARSGAIRDAKTLVGLYRTADLALP